MIRRIATAFILFWLIAIQAAAQTLPTFGSTPLGLDAETSALYNGSSSLLVSPSSGEAATTGQETIWICFKTGATQGKLFGIEDTAMGASVAFDTGSVYINSNGTISGGFNNGSNQEASSAAVVTDSIAHCAAITYNSAVVNLYLDGTLAGAKSTALAPSTIATSYYRVGNGTGPNATWVPPGTSSVNIVNGNIEKVAFFKGTALTAAQIASLWTSFSGRTPVPTPTPPAPTATPTPSGPLTLIIAGSPTSGPATLATAFTASPSGGTTPYTYAWVFGDGGTATTQNPSHNYTVAGTYTATLTVTDSASASVSQVKTVLATGTTFYDSQATGADTNSGLTPSLPFKTLSACQNAMRASGTIKTCTIIDSQTYTLNAVFPFTASDQGEVWVPGFGQTPKIDGSANQWALTMAGMTSFTMDGITFQNMGTVPSSAAAVNIGGSGYTFRWNTFNNLPRSAITANFTNTSSSLIDSNTVNGGGAAVFNGNAFDGAFEFGGSVGGITVTHNLCQNQNAACVKFTTAAVGQSNNKIDFNQSENVVQHCVDCAAYYFYDKSADPNPTAATGNEVKFNTNYTNSNPAFFNHCVYLDAWMANVPVTGNVCTSYKAGTTGGLFTNANGALPFEFGVNTSGNNDTVTNNIFEIGGTAVSYGDFYDCGGDDTTYPFAGCANNEKGTYVARDVNAGQTGKVFSHNIVFSRNGQTPTWDADGLVTGINAAPNPWTIAGNDFFSTNNATFPSATWNAQWTYRFTNSTSWVDSTRVTTNPGFTNPTLNDYRISNPPPGWVTLPTNVGPVNSPFQSAGSAF